MRCGLSKLAYFQAVALENGKETPPGEKMTRISALRTFRRGPLFPP